MPDRQRGGRVLLASARLSAREEAGEKPLGESPGPPPLGGGPERWGGVSPSLSDGPEGWSSSEWSPVKFVGKGTLRGAGVESSGFVSVGPVLDRPMVGEVDGWSASAGERKRSSRDGLG
jgi:hypothetical protein